MKKVGILGASGYTGIELIKILLNHKKVEMAVLNSRTYAGKPVSVLAPGLKADLAFTNYSTEQIKEMGLDMLFLAMPNGFAMQLVPQFEGTKIVDLSADYRFKSAQEFEKVYGIKHSDKKNLSKAVYGLPELFGAQIKKAEIVANPGCYATACILTGLPLAEKKLASHIIFDCKSGYSGAGRGETQTQEYQEKIKDNLIAYNVSSHRHLPEMQQFLPGNISLTPHVMPIFRGIMCTMHAVLRKKISAAEIKKLYERKYKGEKFVDVLESIPDLHLTQNTNLCAIGGFEVDGSNRLVAVSTIDNLVRGASGQAVRNMNLMLGFGEGEGLV